MNPLTRADLWSLEQYAERRPAFRAQVIAHKKNRQIALGEHARLYFEDRITIQYQVQEMLRIERVFEARGIQEELDAYNPLISGGRDLKATFMIEYDDPAERAIRLSELVGVEDRVWLQVGRGDKLFAIADEDLERSRADKTSAVHFLRFSFGADVPGADMIHALKTGASLTFGIDHPRCPIAGVAAVEATRASLAGDLDA